MRIIPLPKSGRIGLTLPIVKHSQLGSCYDGKAQTYLMDLEYTMTEHLRLITAMIRDLKFGDNNLSEDQILATI